MGSSSDASTFCRSFLRSGRPGGKDPRKRGMVGSIPPAPCRWPAGAPCLTTTPCVCPAGGGGGGCGVGVGRPMRMTCRPEFVSAACHAAVAGAPPGSAGGRTASRTSARVITSRFIAPSFPVSPDNSGPDRGFGHLREVNLVVLAAGRREDEGARGGQAHPLALRGRSRRPVACGRCVAELDG